jgi:hypothetical protein
MRRRVLDVAAELFHSCGYHQTSMHDISREARVTSGALRARGPVTPTCFNEAAAVRPRKSRTEYDEKAKVFKLQ